MAFKAVNRVVGTAMGSEERKGTRSEGVDSWRELSYGLADCTTQAFHDMDSPQNNAAILSSSSGVLPCTSTQFGIYGTSCSAIRTDKHTGDPCVDDKTGARFKWV